MKITMKTKSQISGYILRSAAALLLFSCVIVALSSAINAPNKTPKFPAPQNNAAFGVNGRGSPSVWGGNTHAYANENCMPNDYTITTGSGIIVYGITDTGNHCDDCVTPIALPFPVTFYDQTFFSVGISSNGNLQFTSTSDSDFFNECPLPSARVIDLIAPYWDDLHDEDTANGQGVFTSVSGTAPNRIFNIEFRENFFGVAGPPILDFEVCLHEDTPNFEIIYGALNGNTGDSATVGAQRDTGSYFTQFECNTGGLVDGLQLNFVYASGCASPTPTPTPTASLAPCENYVTTTDTASIVPGTTDIGNHCDDCATTITFPFPVTLYGYTFTTANASANGALYLTGTSDSTNGCLALPDPDFGRAIFPFQGGLLTNNPEPGCAGYPDATCGIFTSVTGTEPNQQFNIEWRAVLASDPTSPANFEVVFYENMPSFFDIIYGVIGDNGGGETSGVQASGVGPVTIFSCGTTTLTNSLKVTYSCAEASPTPTATATFTPTATATATFTPTATATFTPTATATFTPTPTPTATFTPTATATATPTATATATATPTPTITPTPTPTPTPTTTPAPTPAGKVTGGGEITVTGGWANFGFNAQNGPGGPKGQLEYQNHARNLNVHSVSITSVNVSDNNASFSGTCTKNGAPCTFTVNAQDNGEPGTSDRFTIAVSGEPMEGGQISNGNIQIHN
jgi:hypothetical protein